jgi:ABC-type sugar transport system substrate-binding protein
MGENKLYATVLQDAIGQSSTAFGIVLEFAKTGAVYGKTVFNLTPPKTPLSEDPFDDTAVIGQCYAVPFVPVTKVNYKDYLAK